MSDDDQLFRAWQAGDAAAGQALVERHYDAVVRFFRSKAGAEAHDLVQRTFLACAEARDRYRGDGSFRAFLFGIARNLLFEHIRGRVRDQRFDPDLSVRSIREMLPGVSTIMAERAEQQLLLEALQRIPVDLQILLELYYWEDLGVGEVASVVGVPAGTVKSRLHRARGLLREAMSAVPASPEAQDSVRRMLDAWAAQPVTPT